VSAGLTIGQLAEDAGTQPGTLRMWEARYGFPRARRLASGHRRYSADELQRVRDVLTLRETGLSLRAAIDRVLSEPEEAPASIFAALRRRLPELTAHPLPKRLLLPLSHAIEDEASAAGEGGLLAGSFQRERFYRQSEARWRLLAAPAELSFVLADFDELRTPSGAPAELPAERTHPLAREWSLLWDAPGFAACLAARERSHPGLPDAERVFDTIWSVERDVVRQAAQVALVLARAAAPGLELTPPARIDDPAGPDADVAQRATALTNRMLAYVAAT
jgi:DICT domain-containing protein